MKKHFLKKGVAMLGAISLLANVMLPGMQAFAISENDWELGCWKDGEGKCNSDVGTYDVAIDGNKITFSNINLRYPGEGVGRPTGEAGYYGVKIIAPAADTTHTSTITIGSKSYYMNNDNKDGVEEDGRYFLYYWPHVTAEEVITALNNTNGIVTQTVTATINEIPTTLTIEINVNNLKYTATDGSTVALEVKDGKVEKLNGGSVNWELGCWKDGEGKCNSDVGTYNVAVEGNKISFSNINLRYPGEGVGRPTGEAGYYGVKIIAPAADTTHTSSITIGSKSYYMNNDNKDGVEEDGRYFLYYWPHVTTGAVVDALNNSNGIITETVKGTFIGVETSFTIEINVKDLVYIVQGGADTDIDLQVVNGEIKIIDGKNTLSADKGSAEIEQDDGTGTGMVVEAATPTSLDESAVEGKLGSSTKQAELEGSAELNVFNTTNGDGLNKSGSALTTKVNFTKAVLVRIPVKLRKNVRFKVRHNGESDFTTEGLAKAACDCTGGVAEDSSYAYNGEEVEAISGYAKIYTCGASLFVAYTETPKQNGAGGGGSSTTSTTTSGSPSGSAGSTSGPSGSSATPSANTSTSDTTTDSNVSESTEEKAPVVISDAAKAAYGEEQLAAYQWAYENGITTINDADKARLGDPLTRAELAKMMSQYISSVLKKSPLKTDEPSYSDVKVEELGDLVDFITKAYQYQIMGINADGSALAAFNPFGIVSRGEFATVFSRVLYGDKYNKEGDDFYTNHLAALKEAGVLSVDTPTIQEVRGWVMLMMYRSAQEKAPVAEEENTAEEGTGESVGIANPASTYCVEQGGEVVIKEDADGAQYGVCKLKDGTEVEEWEYYRANHKDEASTGAVAETGSVAETTTGSVAEAATGDAQ